MKKKQPKKQEKAETPKALKPFEKKYGEVLRAFNALGEACHEKGGPLEEKTRRLVKLALAVGCQHEGAVHSAVRQARKAGVSKAEMMHVAVLGVTTLGWPAAFAAMTWIDDLAEGK